MQYATIFARTPGNPLYVIVLRAFKAKVKMRCAITQIEAVNDKRQA
jgi:hypothetical protein